MKNGTRTSKGQFSEGNQGGPGRPPVPEDVRRIRKINTVEFERIANKYLYMDLAEAEASLKKPGVPLIELMVASVIQRAIKEGDQHRLDSILNRLVGRVPMKVVMPVPESDEPRLVREISGLSDDEVEAQIKLLEGAR